MGIPSAIVFAVWDHLLPVLTQYTKKYGRKSRVVQTTAFISGGKIQIIAKYFSCRYLFQNIVVKGLCGVPTGLTNIAFCFFEINLCGKFPNT